MTIEIQTLSEDELAKVAAGRARKYPFDALQVGQFFKLPAAAQPGPPGQRIDEIRAQNSVAAAASKYAKRAGVKLKIVRRDDGLLYCVRVG